MVKHFSHRHELDLCSPQPVQPEEETLICSGCEFELHPSGEEEDALVYKCTKSCNFFLHDFCLHLPREILHNSHPKHPLLLSLRRGGEFEFTCNACGECGSSGFTFHCPKCKFDLHAQCATLPQTPSLHQHHPHLLTLLFSLPNVQENKRVCNLCKGSINSQGCWLYYCKACDYATHLHCSSTSEAAAEC